MLGFMARNKSGVIIKGQPCNDGLTRGWRRIALVRQACGELVRDRLKDAAGMHCGETAETLKVGHVQREYVANAMHVHRCS